MKTSGNSEARARRREADRADYIPSPSLSKFSESLQLHVQKKLKESLEKRWEVDDASLSRAKTICPSVSTDTIVELLELMVSSINIVSNHIFAETGRKLSMAIAVAPANFMEDLLMKDKNSIPKVISWYDEYVSSNKQVFDSIQQHHSLVKEREWGDVALNTSALEDYSKSAHAMGSKPWVRDANQWIVSFVHDFYFSGGVQKYWYKSVMSTAGGAEFPQFAVAQLQMAIASLSGTLMSSCSAPGVDHAVVRVLDVGSCYNPFKHCEGADSLAITAIDLHPVPGTGVAACDFLTVDVGDDYIESPVVAADTAGTRHETEAAGNDNGTQMQRVSSLPMEYYHVVAMSLVLSYLRSPQEREVMVRKALSVLQPGHGILVIVEKESIFRRVHGTGKKEKESAESDTRATLNGWKKAMARYGFRFVKYEYRIYRDEGSIAKDAEDTQEDVGSSGATAATAAAGAVRACGMGQKDKRSHIMVFSNFIIEENDEVVEESATEDDKLWIKQDLV